MVDTKVRCEKIDLDSILHLKNEYFSGRYEELHETSEI